MVNGVSQGKESPPLLLKCSKTGPRCMAMIYYAPDVISFPLVCQTIPEALDCCGHFCSQTQPRMGYLDLEKGVSQGKESPPLLLKCSKTGLRCMGMICHASDVMSLPLVCHTVPEAREQCGGHFCGQNSPNWATLAWQMGCHRVRRAHHCCRSVPKQG